MWPWPLTLGSYQWSETFVVFCRSLPIIALNMNKLNQKKSKRNSFYESQDRFWKILTLTLELNVISVVQGLSCNLHAIGNHCAKYEEEEFSLLVLAVRQILVYVTLTFDSKGILVICINHWNAIDNHCATCEILWTKKWRRSSRSYGQDGRTCKQDFTYLWCDNVLSGQT